MPNFGVFYNDDDDAPHYYQCLWFSYFTTTFQFKNDVDFRVQAGDRVGWTCEGFTGIISFQYVDEHKTYFRKVEGNDYPILQNTYTFDNIHLPSIFSVAVQIDPSKYMCEYM